MPDSDAIRQDELLPFSPDTPLMEGMPVVDEDGEPLGTVGEDATDRFRVAAPLAPDYWLPKNLIIGMAPGGDIVVGVEADDIDEVKIDDDD
jgi:hypothetical protein